MSRVSRTGAISRRLGRYVTVTRGTDGDLCILFEAPARVRPSGWRAAIPLPIDGRGAVDLADAATVARIRTDAAELLASMDRERRAQDRADLEAGKMPRRLARTEGEGTGEALTARQRAGRRGGASRAANLTPEERSTIARKAARTRWKLAPQG